MRQVDVSLVGSTEYGGKAAGLALLLGLGFPVPDAFVINPDDPLDEALVWQAVEKWTNKAFDKSGKAWLAVRSSSLAEDSEIASRAGEFKSIVGTVPFGPGDLTQAIKEIRESGPVGSISVIVQVAIDSLSSGVAFSCDPVSFERAPYVISWVIGPGNSLVSGHDEGSLLVLHSADDVAKGWPHQAGTLREIVYALDRIEDNRGCPIDIEWAIDHDGRLWLLQARPVVLPHAQNINARFDKELDLLPGVIAGHPKMRLRAAAVRTQVAMSNAVVYTGTHGASTVTLPKGLPSSDAAGLSVVLLHPSGASRKVQREFAQVDGFDVPFFTEGCRRYAIRRYPSKEKATAVAEDVLRRGLQESWLAGIVVQEIYDAEATGIVRKLGEEFLVELAVGHFVPKGIVDPNRFIVSASGRVLESHRVNQDTAYRFINGHVVTEHPVEEQLRLSDEEVGLAVGQIALLFEEYPRAALEFGVLRQQNGAVSSYVIDMAEGDSESCATQLDRNLIRAGVVSAGRTTGRVFRVPNSTSAELDMHLLEGFEIPEELLEDTIIVADRASVDLLELVNRCGRNTAFVFHHASVLAHLCVVLRERGIPAVVLEDNELYDALSVNSVVTVEASDRNWDGRRVLQEIGQMRVDADPAP